MQDSNIPAKFPIPFGNAATIITNPIPTASQANGHASLTDGFPPINSTAIGAGGIPPWGSDSTGVHFMETAAIRWIQAGGPWYYDADFQTAIGGYPKGAIIASAATFGLFWLCLVDNNTTDPDTGGANWAQWPPVLYGADSGTLNALAVTLPVPLAALSVGTIVQVNPGLTTTSTTPTLAINGGSALTITLPTGDALPVGAIVRHTPAAIMVGPTSQLWLVSALPPQLNNQIFGTSGTFIVPVGVIQVEYEIWGAGGGGGGTLGPGSASAAGGGGGYCYGIATGLTTGQAITVTIGAGGAGGDGSPQNGTSGGSSSFGAFGSATGGGGGLSANNAVQTTPSAGGTGTGGSLTFNGIGGGTGYVASGAGLSAALGGAAFKSPASGPQVQPGATPGFSGAFPGVGGNGSIFGASGGIGANGLVIVRWAV